MNGVTSMATLFRGNPGAHAVGAADIAADNQDRFGTLANQWQVFCLPLRRDDKNRWSRSYEAKKWPIVARVRGLERLDVLSPNRTLNIQ